MKCKSIYNIINPYLNKFPIWKIDGHEFHLVACSMHNGMFGGNTSIEFNIVRSYDLMKIIPLNTWRKISNKAKLFLFQHFHDLKTYTEYMYLEDKHISITIEF